MREIARIVCPTDFSEPSRHAMEHAVVLARWYEAPIMALHVHTPARLPVPDLEMAGYGQPAYADTPDLEPFRAATRDFFAPAADAGVEVQVNVEVGQAAAQIVRVAGADPSTVIVIGTHGASGFQRLLLGSVTEKVLRTAACPVMTVPPRARLTSRMPYKRVLCPVDFSSASQAAVELALSFAQEGDATLTLLHVLEWPAVEEAPPSTRAFNVPEYRLYREKEARASLEKLVPDAARDWCTPEIRVVAGKPYQEILRAAAQDAADVIIMGVHGRNVLDQMIFGSTTNQVVRQATCPVLTLRR